ncbi:MAG: hypothetical protein AAGE94_01780 [Acidobacteriota bacterium]
MADETQQTTITLNVGSGSQPGPAPGDMLESLKRLEVTQTADGPCGFQLTFDAPRFNVEDTSQSAEYPILSDDLLTPFNRVQISVSIKSTEDVVLMDGYILRQEIEIEDDATFVTVLGEDVSVKMDLIEVSVEFQNLKDSDIVSQILGNYSSLGVTASVTAPSGESAPSDFVPQQNCTDRFYVRMLARRYGYDFSVIPGSSAGSNTAYWGPPKTDGTPQAVLSANFGPKTNVKKLEMSYDARVPTQVYGQVLDLTQNPAQVSPVALSAPSWRAGLSETEALSTNTGIASDPTSFYSSLDDLDVRGSLLYHSGLDVSRATALATGKANRSVVEVQVIEGELDTETYGNILEVAGLVDLRGVGATFDGRYLVRQVTHIIEIENDEPKYTQKFILSRGGYGTTISEVADY